jgi:hypothetical protein
MNTIPIETLRELFISYQSQFYDDEMYSLIAQSDQTQAIRKGSYDGYITENFTIKNGGLAKKKKESKVWTSEELENMFKWGTYYKQLKQEDQ